MIFSRPLYFYRQFFDFIYGFIFFTRNKTLTIDTIFWKCLQVFPFNFRKYHLFTLDATKKVGLVTIIALKKNTHKYIYGVKWNMIEIPLILESQFQINKIPSLKFEDLKLIPGRSHWFNEAQIVKDFSLYVLLLHVALI